MKLDLVDDELAGCVGCGLCLPHCPTFRVTGEEALSPRGRIAAMREVHWRGAPVDDEFVRIVDTCVQCRGCETACPSGVQFGHLMADTRASLVADRSIGYQPWWKRLGYRALGHHRLLLTGSAVLGVAQRTRLVPSARFGLPARVPVRQPALRPSGTDVYLFTGCVMDAWQRRVHAATQSVIEATGAGVAFLGPGGACCGALHEHAGLDDQLRVLARRVMAAAPGPAPILVDSAGCGAMLKDYGRVLGTDEAVAFSARVLDVHEWLADRMDRLPSPTRPTAGVVAVQDPCHLRHVQHAHDAVRAVLAPYVERLVELDDEGLCCGAGGAYASEHRELAGDIRARKVAAIERTGATVVASANPGCLVHLAGAGLDVRHPMELVAAAVGSAAVTASR
jgi:glycolate oxidase iron-sulfur subunit